MSPRGVAATTPRATGRRWAYLGALLGGVVSVLANVAHSYVPPAGVSTLWRPPAGAVVGAVFWPVALFVAIEILARVAWPSGRRWFLLRFGGLLPVALVAAVVSYRHLSGLLAFYREDPLTVVIGPLAVDGLMVVASAALVATARVAGARKIGDLPRVTTDDGSPAATTEATPLPLPPVAPAPALVEPVPAVEPLREAEPEASSALATAEGKPKKPSSGRTISAPRRDPELTRRLVIAAAVDGLKPAEIGATLGLSTRRVNQLLRPVDDGKR